MMSVVGEHPPERETREPLPPGWVEVDAYRGPDRRIRRRSRRFVERYERRRDGQHMRLAGPLRVLAGMLLILLGIAIGWLPGPGFVILALPGAFLVAGEVRRAATMLDRAENETIPRMQLAWASFRGRAPAAWVERDPELWREWEQGRQVAAGEPADPGAAARLDDPDPADQDALPTARPCTCGGASGRDS